MMTNLQSWWNNKTDHRRQNWLLLALALIFVASGMVEQFMAGSIVAMLPIGVLVWLELKRP